MSASVVYCGESWLAMASTICAVAGAGSRHVRAIIPTRAVPEAEMATPPWAFPFAFAFALALALAFSLAFGCDPSLSGDVVGVVFRPPFGGVPSRAGGLAVAALLCFF